MLKTMGEISKFMRCDSRTIKKLHRAQGFPLAKVGGQYISSTSRISEWINDQFLIVRLNSSTMTV